MVFEDIRKAAAIAETGGWVILICPNATIQSQVAKELTIQYPQMSSGRTVQCGKGKISVCVKPTDTEKLQVAGFHALFIDDPDPLTWHKWVEQAKGVL